MTTAEYRQTYAEEETDYADEPSPRMQELLTQWRELPLDDLPVSPKEAIENREKLNDAGIRLSMYGSKTDPELSDQKSLAEIQESLVMNGSDRSVTRHSPQAIDQLDFASKEERREFAAWAARETLAEQVAAPEREIEGWQQIYDQTLTLLTDQYAAYHPEMKKLGISRDFKWNGMNRNGMEGSLNLLNSSQESDSRSQFMTEIYAVNSHREHRYGEQTWNAAEFSPDRYQHPQMAGLQRTLINRAAAALQEIFPESVGHPENGSLHAAFEQPKWRGQPSPERVANASWKDLQESFAAQEFLGPQDCAETAAALAGIITDAEPHAQDPMLRRLQNRIADYFAHPERNGGGLADPIFELITEGNLYQNHAPEKELDFTVLTDLKAANAGQIPGQLLALKVEQNLAEGFAALNFVELRQSAGNQYGSITADHNVCARIFNGMLRETERALANGDEGEFAALMGRQEILNQQLTRYGQQENQDPFAAIFYADPADRIALETQLNAATETVADPVLNRILREQMRRVEEINEMIQDGNHENQRGDSSHVGRCRLLAVAAVTHKIAATEV